MRPVRFALLFLVTVCASALPHAQPTLPPAATLYPRFGADEADRFGDAIAMNADWLVAGASMDYSGGAERAGAVYLFAKKNNEWVFDRRLTAPQPVTDAGFGYAVALDRNVLTIGEPFREGGAVHVFEYENRTWANTETIDAPLASPTGFGSDLDLDDETLVVAAPVLGSSGQGRAYVYAKASEDWTFEGSLLTSSTWQGEQRVAVSADRIAVVSMASQAVDVFEAPDGTWTRIVSLIAPWNGLGFDLLGDRLLVGVRSGHAGAAAYLYEWTGTMWDGDILDLPATPSGTPGLAALTPTKAFVALTAEDPAASTILEYTLWSSGWALREAVPIDPIGDISLSGWASIAAHDEAFAVGWLRAEVNQQRIGAVSLFRAGDLARARQPVVTLNDRPTDRSYGRALALDGPRLVIAADEATSVYLHSNGQRDLEAEIAGGSVVALDGTRILVGAPETKRVFVYAPGPPDVYGRRELSLEQEFGGSDTFGTAVALNSTTLLIGRPGTASDTGHVAVYGFDGNHWIPQGQIVSPDSISGDRFGASIALDGARAVIGAPGRRHAEGTYGDAYVFELATDGWEVQASLNAPGQEGRFGHAVALDGGRLLVGAPRLTLLDTAPGAVYVFGGTGWRLSQTLLAPNDEDSFGSAVALDGNRAIIGAPLGARADGPDAEGAAFVYGFNGSTWALTQRMTPEAPLGRMAFGSSVSIQGRSVAAGAPANSLIGPAAGAAYLFEVPFAVGIDDAPVADASSALSPPRPNPSTSETRFALTLEAPDHITVTVYDALGRQVSTPQSASYVAGTHTLKVGDRSLPPGLYHIRVTGETVSASRAFTRAR